MNPPILNYLVPVLIPLNENNFHQPKKSKSRNVNAIFSFESQNNIYNMSHHILTKTTVCITCIVWFESAKAPKTFEYANNLGTCLNPQLYPSSGSAPETHVSIVQAATDPNESLAHCDQVLTNNCHQTRARRANSLNKNLPISS